MLLARSKGQNSGWIVITVGWGVAVTIAVYSVGRISGAHLNPAVTIALAMLLFGVLAIGANAEGWVTAGEVDLSQVFSRALQPLLVGILVLGIGLSLGGPTGYAINPARDLGPRIAHAILPIPGKGASDWAYSWIPVIGPIAGGIAGAALYWSVGF